MWWQNLTIKKQGLQVKPSQQDFQTKGTFIKTCLKKCVSKINAIVSDGEDLSQEIIYNIND